MKWRRDEEQRKKWAKNLKKNLLPPFTARRSTVDQTQKQSPRSIKSRKGKKFRMQQRNSLVNENTFPITVNQSSAFTFDGTTEKRIVI
jgi:hypothetical protein